jgi:hypothetical protein
MQIGFAKSILTGGGEPFEGSEVSVTGFSATTSQRSMGTYTIEQNGSPAMGSNYSDANGSYAQLSGSGSGNLVIQSCNFSGSAAFTLVGGMGVWKVDLGISSFTNQSSITAQSDSGSYNFNHITFPYTIGSVSWTSATHPKGIIRTLQAASGTVGVSGTIVFRIS